MIQKSLNRFKVTSLLRPWQGIDWILLSLVVALTVFGGVMIRSTELSTDANNWTQHWVTGALGLGLTLAIARCRYEMLAQWHWVIYGLTNLSLLAVKFFGTTALGAERWITIGGFNVQPSEFAKVGTVITLAAILSQRTAPTLSQTMKALAVVALPCFLVFIQPSLGTTLVFGAIILGMLYWSNAHSGVILLLVSPIPAAILFNLYLPGWMVWIALMGLISWFVLSGSRFWVLGIIVVNLVSGILGQMLWGLLHNYQKLRLVLFLDPHLDPLGGGYHLIQSRIAVGSGELWGRGLHQGTQTQLNFIPEQHTDFIFSAIGEELGFAGSMLVLLACWLICLRLVIIAQNAKDNFGSLLVIGVFSMFIFQILVNIGMTIGLAPITGIPLPLLSYGRSALLTKLIAVGLVESVANHRRRPKF
jgi:rod shape determining protein RodA